MFGENPVRKQELSPGGDLDVQEVFATIQGEGPYAGIASIFVRLWGCNLRCWFCDTDFESKRERSQAWYLEEQIQQLVEKEAPGAFLVVLTGGEPLRQNIIPLLTRIVASGMRVQIETAGTLWVAGLEQFIETGAVDLVCSPKTPAVHPMTEKYCKHFKYIISASEPRDAQDGLPLAYTQNPATITKPDERPRLYRAPEGATIWVQPCEQYLAIGTTMKPHAGRNELNAKACTQLVMRHGYRMSLQTHKILGLR